MMTSTRRKLLTQLGASALWIAARPAQALSLPLFKPRMQVVRPGDEEYDLARQDYNGRFDVFPSALLFARNAKDVSSGIQWARARGVPFRARSGGHSYEGYSLVDGGLVIDVSQMNQVRLSRSGGRVEVGAGIRLLDLYQQLWSDGVTLPMGSCPSVGVAGLTLGGGLGLLSRSLGLTCDSLLEVELVTADGRRTRANRFRNADLFWALCGGGGGNFGIATSFTFQTYPIGNVSIYAVTWPWEDLPEVLRAWQRWAPYADRRLVSVLRLPQKGGGRISSAGQFVGGAEALRGELAPLLAAGSPGAPVIQELPFIEAVYGFAGVAVDQRREMALGLSFDNPKFKNGSAFARAPLNDAAISALLAQLESAPGPENFVQLDALGGAIADVAPGDTAFVHRQSLFSLQYQAFWMDDGAESANLRWIDSVRDAMAPHMSGAYVNYIDAALPDWAAVYYGGNLEGLRRIKAEYDPDDVFHFPQSIPLP